MTNSPKRGSFEDFVRWLAAIERNGDGANVPLPETQVLTAARDAWREHQSMQSAQRAALADRVRSGKYVEEVELMAAADGDRDRRLPRLRTPNGFSISALYAGNKGTGVAPVALLVECPADLVEVFRGQKVHISSGGRWVEVGEIDVDGKATGDLPAGMDFRPPFAFRVGALGEYSADPPQPDDLK